MIPGEYKIVETIYDNDDDDHLDLKQNLDDELVSLDKNIMDLYDMHKNTKKKKRKLKSKRHSQ